MWVAQNKQSGEWQDILDISKKGHSPLSANSRRKLKRKVYELHGSKSLPTGYSVPTRTIER